MRRPETSGAVPVCAPVRNKAAVSSVLERDETGADDAA